MVSSGVILSKRYLVQNEIGSGGMGAVFEATDLRTGAQVAVKVLHPLYARNPQYISRLRREAQIAASIRTPRVVRVVDLDEHEGMPFLVMEYVAGENLSDRLHREGPFPLPEALHICIEITRALEGAHAAGATHRDLKPSNVKITEEGEVKVLDFGIARAQYLPEITGTNAFTGTPEYCAPERVEGEGDIRSDIYSLGVILYELLTGRLPFTGPNAFAILRKHELEPVPSLPFPVPPQVQQVIDRTLAKDPAARYQTPSELMAGLRAARDVVLGVSPGPVASGVSHGQFVPATVVDPAAQPEAGPARTVAAPGVRTVTRPPGMEGPTIPGNPPLLSPRNLALAGGGVVAALAIAVGVIVMINGDGPRPMPTPSIIAGAPDTPIPTLVGTPAPTLTSPTLVPTQPPQLRVLAPGDTLKLVDKQSIAEIELEPGTCQGSPRPVIRDVLKVVEIARDSRETRLVTVAYERQVPRIQGLQCVLPYAGDVRNMVLEVMRPSGVRYRVGNVGGTGLGAAGVSDIYGKSFAGSWTFDDVDVEAIELSIVQIKAGEPLDSGTELHRIRLLPR